MKEVLLYQGHITPSMLASCSSKGSQMGDTVGAFLSQ